MGELKPAELGARIRAARERAGVSRTELARRLGVHLNTLARWEAGERVVPADALVKISESIEIGVEGLLHGEKKMGVADEPMPYGSDLAGALTLVKETAASLDRELSRREISALADLVMRYGLDGPGLMRVLELMEGAG